MEMSGGPAVEEWKEELVKNLQNFDPVFIGTLSSGTLTPEFFQTFVFNWQLIFSSAGIDEHRTALHHVVEVLG